MVLVLVWCNVLWMVLCLIRNIFLVVLVCSGGVVFFMVRCRGLMLCLVYLVCMLVSVEVRLWFVNGVLCSVLICL